MSVTTLLRPIHLWFFFWERIIPSLYRVVATGLLAVATAVVLMAVGIHPLIAVPLGLVAAVGLAIAQDHDQRVTLPPEPEFAKALGEAVERSPLALQIDLATGPRRARGGSTDFFAMTGNPTGLRFRHFYISVERSAKEGWMALNASTGMETDHIPIETRLQMKGHDGLARRVNTAIEPRADAAAVIEAIEVLCR